MAHISHHHFQTSIRVAKVFHNRSFHCSLTQSFGLPEWLSDKEFLANADVGLILVREKIPWKIAIHSRIPAWEIPWVEVPVGLQSTGVKRVRYDLATKPPPPAPLLFTARLICEILIILAGTHLPRPCSLFFL